MKINRFIFLLIFCLALASCATPTVVDVVMPEDEELNCLNLKDEFCISPLKSLSLHLTNVNSSYGLSPFIDYEKIWKENKIIDT